MDLKQWYADVTAARKMLDGKFSDGFCYVMSVTNRDTQTTDGSIAQVNLDNASRLLARKSHRMATDDEIKAHLAQQEIQRQANQRESVERARKQFARLIGEDVDGPSAQRYYSQEDLDALMAGIRSGRIKLPETQPETPPKEQPKGETK